MSKSWIINFYSLTKFLYPKNCCLYCLVFAQFSFVGLFLIVLCFLHLKIFLREINREKVVLIASIAILLIWTPLNPPMVFFTKLFYLHAPSFKCVNLLWSFVRISSFCQNLSLFVCESFWTLLICENIFLFMIICQNLFLFMIIVRIS